MNPKDIMQILGELRILPFFPNDSNVMVALLRLVGNMCHTQDQVRWLVGRMTSGIYPKWPGDLEMRACFCCRYKPKDGIVAYSTVYLDGNWPADPSVPRIEGPLTRSLPPGDQSEINARMDAAMRIAIQIIQSKQPAWNGPVTAAEIAAAPEWLRRLEGYE